MGGESLFLTHFTNKNPSIQRKVAFAAPFPGKIVLVNMANVGQKLICQKDAFLYAALGMKLSIHFNQKIGTGLFSKEDFILQKLEGDGMVFIQAAGCIVKKELNGGQIHVDAGCLVAYTSGVDFNITPVKGLKLILLGGEGLFLATSRDTVPFGYNHYLSVECAIVFKSSTGTGGNMVGQIAGGIIGEIFR